MSKIINTILLSTTLLMISCSKGHTSNTHQKFASDSGLVSNMFDIRQMYMTLMNSVPLSFNVNKMQAGGIAPGFRMHMFGSGDSAFYSNKNDLAVLGFNKCIYKMWESLLMRASHRQVEREENIMEAEELKGESDLVHQIEERNRLTKVKRTMEVGGKEIYSPMSMPLPLRVERMMKRNLNVDKYSFHYYNIPSNIGNYINVDTVNRLFSSACYDRKYSQSDMMKFPLVLATDTLYLGLTGNRNVIVSGKLYAEYIKHIERQFFLMHEEETPEEAHKYEPKERAKPEKKVPEKVLGEAAEKAQEKVLEVEQKGVQEDAYKKEPEKKEKKKKYPEEKEVAQSLFPVDEMSRYPEIISQYNEHLELDNENNTKNAERYLKLVEKYLEMEQGDSKTAQLYVKLISESPILADIYLQLETKNLQAASIFLQMTKNHPGMAILYAFMVTVDTQMADRFLELVEEYQEKVERYLHNIFPELLYTVLLTERPVMGPKEGELQKTKFYKQEIPESEAQMDVDSNITQIFFINLEDIISGHQSIETYLELLLTELIAAINEEYYMIGVPIPPIAFENETITLYGNNSKYNGFITIPQFVQKLYLHNNSLAGIKRFNFINENYIFEDNLSNLTFYLLGTNKLDLKTFGSLLSMSFDNTTETSSSGTLEIIDGDYRSFKKRALFFTGNYDKYNGVLKIPDSIEHVYLKSDLFTKLKHGNNENLSLLTYHLLENAQVDLKNIGNSTFEMNLDSYDGESNCYKIKLIDSSNPTKITKVTFSGDNTKYKKAGDTDPNTGIVELTPYIKEVEFINAPKSLVQLQAFSTTRTVLVNNVLSLEISKIKVIPADYAETVKYTSISEKDSINNIEQYNKPGIIWDTNTIEDCFSDGTELLSNLDLNVIRADLKGDKGITITTADNIITLLGNNSKYTGTITIPENVTDIFLRRISKIKNIVHAEDADLSKLNFHYEEIKPEAKSDKFCVPFTNMKKVIDSKHELCKEVKDTKEKLDEATDNITKLTKEKQETQTQLNTANNRITELEEENEGKENKLLEAENNINDLNQENEENKDKMKKIKIS